MVFDDLLGDELKVPVALFGEALSIEGVRLPLVPPEVFLSAMTISFLC